MDGYAYAEIVGPSGFFAGDDFLLGLLLIGPGRVYLDHYHAAPELYWTLTGPSQWKNGRGGWTLRDAGSICAGTIRSWFMRRRPRRPRCWRSGPGRATSANRPGWSGASDLVPP